MDEHYIDRWDFGGSIIWAYCVCGERFDGPNEYSCRVQVERHAKAESKSAG